MFVFSRVKYAADTLAKVVDHDPRREILLADQPGTE